jgi:hypothetical protein
LYDAQQLTVFLVVIKKNHISPGITPGLFLFEPGVHIIGLLKILFRKRKKVYIGI